MADSLVGKATKGIVWSAIDRFSAQGLAFIFNILIARLLLPSDYGIIAMIEIFISISIAFIDSGFGSALIRKPDRTEEDCNTVFYFNIAVSFVAYLVLWTAAPAISRFYNTPLLVPVIRWIGLKLIFNAFGAIQNTILAIRIEFKARAKTRIFTSVSVGLIGLFLAYKGYGIWVLVVQQLLDSIISTAILWAIIRWKPRLLFSWKSFKEMFSYGSRILAIGLGNAVYGNLYTLVIGKLFSPSDSGKYAKANSLAAFPGANLCGILMSVMFPVLSSIQNDRERLENYYRKTLTLASFGIFPIVLGMAAVARPLITILLTDNWIGMTTYFQILCISAIWIPLDSVNLSLLQVTGKSDYLLRLDIIKKIIGLTILVITSHWGVLVMCIGQVINALINLSVNAFYSKRLIGYSFIDEMRDIFPALTLSVVMSVSVYFLTMIKMSVWLQLFIPVVAGMVIYFSLAYIFKMQSLNDLKTVLLKTFRK